MRTRSILLRIALPVLASAAPFAACAQSQPAPQTPSLTVQTNLVLVPALVLNKSGANVYTLTANDFALTDDGNPQKLSLSSKTPITSH